MKQQNKILYYFLMSIVRIGLFFWHPVCRITGKENLPDGPCVLCGNHAGMADPLWAVVGLWQPRLFRIMAKESLMRVPLLNILLRWAGVIGVRRGENDINAVKEALRALKNGEKLLVYPEGTRVPQGRIEAKTGAIMLATRAGCPVVPLYIQQKRRPFSPMRLVVGQAYCPEVSSRRATAAELHALTNALMDKIYVLGEEKP